MKTLKVVLGLVLFAALVILVSWLGATVGRMTKHTFAPTPPPSNCIPLDIHGASIHGEGGRSGYRDTNGKMHAACDGGSFTVTDGKVCGKCGLRVEVDNKGHKTVTALMCCPEGETP